MFQSVVPDEPESKETRAVTSTEPGPAQRGRRTQRDLATTAVESPVPSKKVQTGDWELVTGYCGAAPQLNELGSRSFSPITPNAASEKPISTAGNGTGTVTSAR